MNSKQFEFQGTAGEYFVVVIISSLMQIVPVFGFALSMNYTYSWLADHTLIQGKKVKYSATFWETFKFMFVNILLVLITFGIYVFWFVPKMYRYIAEHVSFVDQPMAAPAPMAPPMPESPTASQPPMAPIQ